MSNDMDVADVLDAAADYIRMHGWRQGDLGGAGRPACMLGGIDEAIARTGVEAFQIPMRRIASGAALVHVRDLTGNRDIETISDWNDYLNGSSGASKVITALMEAAARVRTGEIKP